MVNLRINVDPPGGGRTRPDPGSYTVQAGTTLTIIAQPNVGYRFSHWLLNGTYHSTGQGVTLTINGDTNLTAFFEPKKVIVSITREPHNGGFTDPQPGAYEIPAGTKFNATATPYEGFLFLHWLLNGKIHSSEQSTTIVVYEDAELTAVFIEQQRGAPSFRISCWSELVSGPIGSTQTFNARVKNVGDAPGDAWVRILDDSRPLASQLITLQPGEEKSISISIQLPTSRGSYLWRVTVENNALGKVDDEKNFTIVAKDLYLAKRNALYYTAFVSLPQGWTAWGGSWTIALSSGRLGTNAIKGVDDDQGPGGASIYYTSTPSGTTIYVASQIHVSTGTPAGQRPDMMGIILRSPTVMYAVIVDYRAAGGDRGFEVHRFASGAWSRVANTRFTPSLGTWYTLIVELSRNLTAYLYSDSAAPLRLSVKIDGFAPEHAGLIIDDGTGFFDNFLISTVSPEHIVVSGLQQGWIVELYHGDTLIGNATADASGKVRIRVISNLIVINGRIVVKDAQKNKILERTFTEVVSGDEYEYGA